MEKHFKDLEFLKRYGEKKLLSIQSIPQWPNNGNHVSNEVVLNFDDSSQLVISSSFADVDTFFDVDEDVLFSIKEESGYEPFCNIGDYKMTTILVDEKPESIKVYFDEIAYEDKTISDKMLAFPIALFVKTATRTIGVCKDALNAVWLDANYMNADQSLMYSLEERWGACEGVESFVVRRHAKDYTCGIVELFEEKQFC